jgi:hypothetical protein
MSPIGPKDRPTDGSASCHPCESPCWRPIGAPSAPIGANGVAWELSVCKGSGIGHFRGSGRPRGPRETLPKGGGPRPPPFGRVSGAPGAAQTHKMTDFRSLKVLEVFVAIQSAVMRATQQKCSHESQISPINGAEIVARHSCRAARQTPRSSAIVGAVNFTSVAIRDRPRSRPGGHRNERFPAPFPPHPSKVQLHTSLRTSARTYRTYPKRG